MEYEERLRNDAIPTSVVCVFGSHGDGAAGGARAVPGQVVYLLSFTQTYLGSLMCGMLDVRTPAPCSPVKDFQVLLFTFPRCSFEFAFYRQCQAPSSLNKLGGAQIASLN